MLFRNEAREEHLMKRTYRVLPRQSSGSQRLEALVTGPELLGDPMLNRGTAFTREERHALGLVGLLPSAITPLEEQVKRCYAQYQEIEDDLRKHIFLTALQDTNEVLFYRLLSEHLYEMLPVVYDPTIARAIEQYSHEYRRPRGVYLSIDHPEDIATALRNVGAGLEGSDPIAGAWEGGVVGFCDA